MPRKWNLALIDNQQTAIMCNRHRMGAVCGAKLLENLPQVKLHRHLFNTEFPGDRLVRESQAKCGAMPESW